MTRRRNTTKKRNSATKLRVKRKRCRCCKSRKRGGVNYDRALNRKVEGTSYKSGDLMRAYYPGGSATIDELYRKTNFNE